MAEFAPAGVVSRCQTCNGEGSVGGESEDAPPVVDCPNDCDGGWVTVFVTCRDCIGWTRYADDNKMCPACSNYGVLPWARVVCPGDTMLAEGELCVVASVDIDGIVEVMYVDTHSSWVPKGPLRLVVPDTFDNPYRVAAGLVP